MSERIECAGWFIPSVTVESFPFPPPSRKLVGAAEGLGDSGSQPCFRGTKTRRLLPPVAPAAGPGSRRLPREPPGSSPAGAVETGRLAASLAPRYAQVVNRS
jgi:hypothetical protein